jgi:hypothetical protein
MVIGHCQPAPPYLDVDLLWKVLPALGQRLGILHRLRGLFAYPSTGASLT